MSRTAVVHEDDGCRPNRGADEEEDDMKDEAVSSRSEIYERQDRLRHALVEYVMADFSGR